MVTVVYQKELCGMNAALGIFMVDCYGCTYWDGQLHQ